MTKSASSITPVAIFGAALLSLAFAPGTTLAQSVGINSAIKHKVQMRKVNTATLKQAKLKDRVSIGDYIKTDPNGVLQILLKDRTNFTVGKNAEATIDRFVYDPAKNASEVALSVTKGAFRFISGKPTRNRKGRSSVKTPVGSIGIRGTIFEGAVGAQAFNIARGEAIDRSAVAAFHPDATLVFLRGPGPETQGDEISGAVDLRTPIGIFPLEKAGDAYFVPRRGAQPIGPFPLSNTGRRILQELFDMTPDRDVATDTAVSPYPGTRETVDPYPFPPDRVRVDPRGPRPDGDPIDDFIDNPGSILDRGDILTPPNPPRGDAGGNPNAVVGQRDRVNQPNQGETALDAADANQPRRDQQAGEEQNPDQQDPRPPPQD